MSEEMKADWTQRASVCKPWSAKTQEKDLTASQFLMGTSSVCVGAWAREATESLALMSGYQDVLALSGTNAKTRDSTVGRWVYG